jgi:hypothetical protein
MVTQLLKSVVAPKGMKSILAAAVLGLSPAAALAGHHEDFRVDFDFRHGRPHIDIYRVPPPPAPPVGNREVRVWVEPVYQTVTDRQWVPAEYRTVVDRVWVPDRFEMREYPRWDHGRRVIFRERVLVAPGHYEDAPRQELVCDGHYEDVQRQVLVTPGHWETRIEPVVLVPQG